MAEYVTDYGPPYSVTSRTRDLVYVKQSFQLLINDVPYDVGLKQWESLPRPNDTTVINASMIYSDPGNITRTTVER